MKSITVTTSDGIVRTVEATVVGDQLRVHRIHGDVTDHESLAEMAQILAIEQKAESVCLSF